MVPSVRQVFMVHTTSCWVVSSNKALADGLSDEYPTMVGPNTLARFVTVILHSLASEILQTSTIVHTFQKDIYLYTSEDVTSCTPEYPYSVVEAPK